MTCVRVLHVRQTPCWVSLFTCRDLKLPVPCHALLTPVEDREGRDVAVYCTHAFITSVIVLDCSQPTMLQWQVELHAAHKHCLLCCAQCTCVPLPQKKSIIIVGPSPPSHHQQVALGGGGYNWSAIHYKEISPLSQNPHTIPSSRRVKGSTIFDHTVSVVRYMYIRMWLKLHVSGLTVQRSMCGQRETG